MSEETSALANFSRVKQALNEVRTLDDTLEIRSQAAAMETYASAKGADEVSQMAMEIKLRAERKAGQFLKDMKEQDLLSKGAATPRGNTMLPRLKDYGIEKIESQRWQRIASIPEEKFGNGELKDGQILALKRLTDDLERSGKPTLCIIASHNISNCNDDVDVAKTIVISYRIKNEWIIPPNSITVKELIVWFLSKIKN